MVTGNWNSCWGLISYSPAQIKNLQFLPKKLTAKHEPADQYHRAIPIMDPIGYLLLCNSKLLSGCRQKNAAEIKNYIIKRRGKVCKKCIYKKEPQGYWQMEILPEFLKVSQVET